ncbi:phosphoserine phosphatase SerB [Hoeflea poritis]|uniref:Phosphoserine phosphatase n=1 Tax=Hoeflea poritis TaxID=2993659 RepID=A0ABT4VP06_9HYPH|nr:phosphoserine phosphatase SerB [Hoeflea poritis]MDA4846440.1 phosphoserine phosphatase SerB [Hoeflea poritis]
MPLVATLITDPSNPVLSADLAADAARKISEAGPQWLAEGVACDLPLKDGLTLEEASDTIAVALDDRPIDIVVQDAEGRRKRLLIADMDSTMIRQECIDELAAEAGFYDKVAAITKRAMNGEIAFEPAMRERVALLKGLDLSIVDRVLENRVTLTPGGRELIATMKQNGAYTALVSGGFTLFTSRVAGELGFDEDRANVLNHQNGKLDGTVAEPVLGQQSKIDALEELTAKLDLSVDDALAVGDGANDLGMLRLAGSGVALHAKPVVAAEAKIRIDHGDLTALLYIQGYSRNEFVGAET